MGVHAKKIFHYIELLCQLMLVIFVFLIFWEIFKSYDLGTLAAWHVLMSVSGVALYVAEGVQLYRRVSLFFDDTDRINRILPHGVVMALGLVHMTIGIALKIKQKVDLDKAHFESNHAIIGLVAWIVMFVTVIGGIVLAKIPLNNKKIIKFCHIIMGLTAYILGIVTIGYGLQYLVEERGKIALIIFMSIYVAYSIVGPCTTLINLFK